MRFLPFLLIPLLAMQCPPVSREPVRCGNPDTYVLEVGKYLNSMKIQYCVDSVGRPIEHDNIIVHFPDGVSKDRIRQLQEEFAPDNIKTCICNERLQNWQWHNMTPVEIEEKVSQVSESAKREGGNALFNYIVHINNPGQNMQIRKDTFAYDTTYGGESSYGLIAILDTGVDLGMVRTGLVKLNNSPALCAAGRPYGWNFVTNDDNILDNNGHGTAVTGIIADCIAGSSIGQQCKTSFMILKMLDQNGVGDLFDAACAVRYAVDAKANILNLSWGYYGLDWELMRESISYANQNSTILTSLGNDGRRVDLQDNLAFHYPSEYANRFPHVIAIGGDERKNIWSSGGNLSHDLWAYSNYTTDRKVLTAPSRSVPVRTPIGVMDSPVPIGSEGMRLANGTSYATGFATASVLISKYCTFTTGRQMSTAPRSSALYQQTRGTELVSLRNLYLNTNEQCIDSP